MVDGIHPGTGAVNSPTDDRWRHWSSSTAFGTARRGSCAGSRSCSR
jgi:hypothetical protein